MLSQTDVIDLNQNYNALLSSLDMLLTELSIPHDSTLESIISTSQIWRRTPGQERWELPELNISKDQKDRAFELLEKLGLITSAEPSNKQYDYALLLGATVPRMKRRLYYLAYWWDQGVRFRCLIFLVGQRPLYPGFDDLDILASKAANKSLDPYPFTETEAAIMLHQLAPMPEAMRAVPVEFVDTPRNWRDGFWHRANTRDTIKYWVKAEPLPGTALIISDQPHGAYQKEVARQELPTGFSVDLAAGPADPETTLPVYLDALALWLHNLKPSIPNVEQTAPLSPLPPP